MDEHQAIEVKEGDILDGKYRVEKILGAGGMGVVVAATHTVLNNRVALKFLLPSVAKKELTAARFLREAQSAVRIRSPHVARVIDVGTMADTGSPYMVMEHLDGRDLALVLETEGALEIEQACTYALQACEALAEAHANGIVHRDIKPANLFLTSAGDGSPVVKVLDFGISKNVVDSGVMKLTQTQTSMGSPLYMSPEQMRSARDVDGRADIWSLGVVLFEFLSGQLPFMAETMPQLCALVLEEDAPRVTAANPDVPEALADVVAKCLQKDRAARYADTGELAKAIAVIYPDLAGPIADRCRRILDGAAERRQAIEAPVATSGLPTGSSETNVAAPGARLRGTGTAFGRTGMDTTGVESGRRPIGLFAAGAVAAVVAGGLLWMGHRDAPDDSDSVAAGRPLKADQSRPADRGNVQSGAARPTAKSVSASPLTVGALPVDSEPPSDAAANARAVDGPDGPSSGIEHPTVENPAVEQSAVEYGGALPDPAAHPVNARKQAQGVGFEGAPGSTRTDGDQHDSALAANRGVQIATSEAPASGSPEAATEGARSGAGSAAAVERSAQGTQLQPSRHAQSEVPSADESTPATKTAKQKPPARAPQKKQAPAKRDPFGDRF